MAEEQKRPSVAEILAAARKQKETGGETPKPPVAESAAEQPAAATPKPAAEKPAAAKPAAGGARPSVADMLAAARRQKGGEAAPAAKPVAAEKPAAPAPKPAAAPKPAVEKAVPVAKAPAAVKETGSVLAAARAGAKPGPITKAEAAALGTADVKDAAAAKAKLAAVPVMPPKPEYAKPKAKKEVEISRAGFIALMTGSAFAIGNTCMAIAGGLATLGFARFMFPNILTEPPSKFKVGFLDAFSNDKVDTRFTNQFGVWVVNTEYNGKREVFALRTVCTHLGCTPNWLEAEQKFKCPCHGSGFYKDGINFEGPAPRPLERYAIRIADDGQVEIDKSKTFQEELGQWADPSCFVPV
ncbi:MAG: ubiquinol-cytochrome c reductase iron-sulfur subunit [Pirellulales bacterium]